MMATGNSAPLSDVEKMIARLGSSLDESGTEDILSEQSLNKKSVDQIMAELEASPKKFAGQRADRITMPDQSPIRAISYGDGTIYERKLILDELEFTLTDLKDILAKLKALQTIADPIAKTIADLETILVELEALQTMADPIRAEIIAETRADLQVILAKLKALLEKDETIAETIAEIIAETITETIAGLQVILAKLI
jgi:hypothetical protein